MVNDISKGGRRSLGVLFAWRSRLVLTLAIFSLLATFGFESTAAAAKTAGWDQMTDQCKEKLFPVSSGGSKDEIVSCTLWDEKNQLILVTGNSTSEDYAPAANDHAFTYALDLDGNWMWGKFFYNVSFAVSTISGCHLDANNKLVLLSTGDSMPVIMEMNTKDGTIEKFISLEKLGTSSDNQPWYKTYGAIHHDTKDFQEPTKSYYYVSFVMLDYTQVLKINSVLNTKTNQHDIVWTYQYGLDTSSLSPVDVWKNKKVPRFLHQDIHDSSRMYLLGRQNGKASVIKFDKRRFGIDWRIEVHDSKTTNAIWATTPTSPMTDILAYVQPRQQRFIYACGFAFVDATIDSV